MKKTFLITLALAALTFTSCEKQNPENPVPTVTTGVFILNEGSMGSSNSNLALYDTDKKQVSSGVFEAVNGKELGDTGNDILIYGSKMYIAVHGSKIIFVTDLEGKIIKEIKHSSDAGELSPSKLTKFEGKVYASYSEGFVGQIDTTSFEVKHTSAGAKPEGIVAINNKIYVANSTAYEAPKSETISVIDIPTFKVSKTIKITENPRFLALADNGDIYVICGGVWGVLDPSLEKINTTTDVVSTISNIVPSKMSMGKDNKLYLLCGEWGKPSNCPVINTTTGTITTQDFITDGTEISNGYSISADPITGNVYIGAGSFEENGDMYVFSAEGKKLDEFTTGGIYPAGAFFISE